MSQEHRRVYKRFQKTMHKRLEESFHPEKASQPETPSRTGRNAKRRAYKREQAILFERPQIFDREDMKD